jgi:NADPH2:quinone reductase
VASILALAGEGKIRPHVSAQVGLDDWREAYLAMHERRVVGRTVILPHG